MTKKHQTDRAGYSLGDHPEFSKIIDNKENFYSDIEKELAQREKKRIQREQRRSRNEHQRTHKQMVLEHTTQLADNFKEYSDVRFDRLREDYYKGDISHAYECFVAIQNNLVEVLGDIYIPQNGELSLQELITYLKKQRKKVRKLDIELHTDPIIKTNGEITALQTLYGAMAHALFVHQLKNESSYTVLDHDRDLDKIYKCDILAHHIPTNTYVAIDVTTTIQEPQQISGAKHHEDLIHYLTTHQIIDQTHFDNGAILTHLIVNPLWRLGNTYHVLIDDEPDKHRDHIESVLNNSHAIIHGDFGFPHE